MRIKEFTCEYCQTVFQKQVSNKRVYKFCSYSCSSKKRCRDKGYSGVIGKFNCLFCNQEYETIVHINEPYSKHCSLSCAGKTTAKLKGNALDTRQKRTIDGKREVKVTCQRCNKEVWLPNKTIPHKYCSKICSAKTNSEIGAGFAINELKMKYWIEQHGIDEANRRLEQMTTKRSNYATQRNLKYGISQVTKEKISASLMGKSYHPWKGKLLVDIMEPERLLQLTSNQSEKASKTLREGYASGRLKVTKSQSPKSSRHKAHGYHFRSKLELCYANELVEKGLYPDIDWQYEPLDLRIPYIGPDNKEHTYFPDFVVLGDIVEVKPYKDLNDDFVLAKAEAAKLIAEELGTKYYFITEKDVKNYRNKLVR